MVCVAEREKELEEGSAYTYTQDESELDGVERALHEAIEGGAPAGTC